MPQGKDYPAGRNPTDQGNVEQVVNDVAKMYTTRFGYGENAYTPETGPRMPIGVDGFDLAPDPYDPTIPVRRGGPASTEEETPTRERNPHGKY